MKRITESATLATGLAMFSMFFGAGNSVFPLALGQYAESKNFFAILGLLITAVAVPFAGLIAMTLFNGNYKSFFDRIGKVPGFLVALFIMGLIGPFGAIPRCIALSFSTIKLFVPWVSMTGFSFVACLVIFIMTYRKNKIVDMLGYYLTPILLITLAIIVIKGFISSPESPIATHTNIDVFFKGLKEGYQTMDLLGAFFFSGIVLVCLQKKEDLSGEHLKKKLLFKTLKASSIGACLLAIVYVGFSYVAAFNSTHLIGVKQDELVGQLAHLTLGPYAGILACIAVAMACLTTAIALCAVFADYIHENVGQNKISYTAGLVLTLVATFLVSTLHFNGIAAFLAPILYVCYPALIVLTVLNFAYKVFNFQPVKTPVAIVFLASLIEYFY